MNNNLVFLKNNFDIKMIDFRKGAKSANDARSFITKCKEKQKQLKEMRDRIKDKIQQELNKATEPNTYIIELIDAGNFPLIKVRNGRTVLCVIRNCTVPLLSTADKIDAHPNSFVFARKKEREILELMDKESKFNNRLQTFLAQSFYFKVHYCIVDKIDNIFNEGMKYLQSQDLQNCLLCFEMVEYISANNLENIISDITQNNVQSEIADPLRIIEQLRNFAKSHQLKDDIQFQKRILLLQILFQVCGYVSDLCNKLSVLAEIGIAIQDIKPSNLLCYCISQQFIVQMGDLKSLVYFENVKGLKNIPFDNFRDLQMLTDAYVTQPKTLLEIASQCLISSLFKLVMGLEPPKKPDFNIDFKQICRELAKKYRWIPEIADLLYKLVLSVPEAGQWYIEVAEAHLEFHRQVITSKKVDPVRKGEFQHYHNPLFDYHIHQEKVKKLRKNVSKASIITADIQQNEENPFELFNDVLNQIKMIIHEQSDLIENCLPQGLIEDTQFRVNHQH